MHVLVAVSGGADSTALLVGLARLAPELRLTVTAAHLHHGLRGADADGDQAHVRAVCADLGVPLVTARWNCRVRMARQGLSGQAGLRTLRRRFLRAAARRAGARWIVTAHTADDQLETLLMRIGRGAGLTGLAGMRPRRGVWLKPLLAVTRADIGHDLRRAGWSWREDASNGDPRWLRSRIRHEAIPALTAALWPGRDPANARALLAAQAGRACREAARADAALGRECARAMGRAVRFHGDGAVLATHVLAAYASGVRRRVLAVTWRKLAPGGAALTTRHLGILCRLLDHGRPDRAAAMLPEGGVAIRAGAALMLCRSGVSTRNGPAARRAGIRRTADTRLPNVHAERP